MEIVTDFILGGTPKSLQVVIAAMKLKDAYSLEDPLEKEMATHSNILAWKILWTEEPGRL